MGRKIFKLGDVVRTNDGYVATIVKVNKSFLKTTYMVQINFLYHPCEYHVKSARQLSVYRGYN